jgi:amino acid adenylation domain-containing protein
MNAPSAVAIAGCAGDATAHRYPERARVDELFEARVAVDPQAVAVIATDGTRVSYRELDARANQLAHHLRRLGMGPESLVAICVEHSVEMFVAVLGVVKSGAAYVPLDPAHPPALISHILTDTAAGALVAQRRLAGALPDDYQGTVVWIDDDWDRIAECPTGRPSHRGDADNLLYVIYTSGSTGRAKGVMVPHRSVVNFLCWAAPAFGLDQGTGSPMLGSIAFDLSLPNFLLPFVTGRAVTLLPVDEPLRALADLLRGPADFSALKLTPGQLEILRGMLPDGSVRSVRTFVVAGDVLRPHLVAAWRRVAPQARIINECGPTETVVGCCVYETGPDDADTGSVPIGGPVANTQLYVLDEDLNPVPPGTPGELYVGGHGVSRGYLGRPGLTAERFLPDPFGPPGVRLYRTGDRVRRRADGNLEFLGRIDFQVKIRGYRVELGEVESVLATHPRVGSVVVAAHGEGTDRRLVAYVVAAGGLPVGELRAWAAQRLPAYMVPELVVPMAELPLGRTGKVDRSRLPAPTGERPDTGCAVVPAATPTQRQLAGIWAGCLGLAEVGVHDNFFDLGGNSMRLLAVLTALRAAGRGELATATLFRYPTIAALAAHLDGVDQPSEVDDARQVGARRRARQASRHAIRMERTA